MNHKTIARNIFQIWKVSESSSSSNPNDLICPKNFHRSTIKRNSILSPSLGFCLKLSVWYFAMEIVTLYTSEINPHQILSTLSLIVYVLFSASIGIVKGDERWASLKLTFVICKGREFFIKKFIFSLNEKRQIGKPVSGEAERTKENILSPWVGSMKISSQLPSKRNKKSRAWRIIL